MNPDVNETQPNNPQDNIDLTNDELAAAMGYMTTLGDQQMMAEQEAMEGQETAESAPEEDLDLETEETPPIDPEALKNEVLGDIKKEMKGLIREELKKLLDDEEGTEDETK